MVGIEDSSDLLMEFQILIKKAVRTRKDIEELASLYNKHPSTIYRWIKRYDPTTNEIQNYHHLKGNYRSNLDPDVERLIREEINHYPNRHKTITAIHYAVMKRILIINHQKKTEFKIPSYVTIRRRFYLSRNL